MNARVLFSVVLALGLITAILMFGSASTTSNVSAQGPIISADEATHTGGSNSPENLAQGAPDDNQPAAPAAGCGVSPLPCQYYHISSSIFQPRNSSYTYAYDGSGCFHHTNTSTDGFMAPVLLPPGITIKYLRIYYKDTNVADMSVQLRYFDDGNSNTDLTSVSTSGNAVGVRTALSPEITHTIDYNAFSYGIVAFESGPIDGSIQLCGVRLAYTQPGIFGLALPLITR